MTLFAEIVGDVSTMPPLVLVHGFGGSHRAWKEVQKRLPDTLPLIVVDLPGHAKSLHAEGRGGAGRMAKAVLAHLDLLGVNEFHLAGHSMGGAVCSLIAMRASERVKSMTLLAPGGMGPEIDADGLEAFARATSVDDVTAAMRPMFATGFDIPGSVIEINANEHSADGASEALLDIYGSMFSGGADGGQGVLPAEQLANLRCPATVLWGSEDKTLPASQMQNLPDNFKKNLIEGKGHMLLDECPDAAAKVISDTIFP